MKFIFLFADKTLDIVKINSYYTVYGKEKTALSTKGNL
jgi:hypothetical protein